MTGVNLFPAGLVAVTGDEGSGKTSLLRRLAGDLPPLPGETTCPDAQWLDLGLPAMNNETPLQVWHALQARSPRWNTTLHQDLTDALGLTEHQHKALYMLSTGSRRKVALAGLLACGATVTCLDQPYAALDLASIQVLRTFLTDVSDHPERTWVVADFQADSRLPWARVFELDTPPPAR